jgi:hypothetical protein
MYSNPSFMKAGERWSRAARRCDFGGGDVRGDEGGVEGGVLDVNGLEGVLSSSERGAGSSAA